jgi:adenylosuccinate lyase
MEQHPLTAISPLDGRYARKCQPLRQLFSEQGLIRLRTLVEVRWLQHLASHPGLPEIPALSPVANDVLNKLVDDFGGDDASRVKEIEKTTNHDVKAVEYFLAQRFGESGELAELRPFLHFACTSEDINNVAYALMLRRGRDELLLPALKQVSSKLYAMSQATAAAPMLARTHGQTATPTTLGKELANVIYRLQRQQHLFSEVPALAKMNGAVGNFNAHVAAYPDVDWPALSKDFLESLGLSYNPYTTQIEPHDWVAEYCDALARANTVLLDACRDIWTYVSLGYFTQRRIEGEVGSSTMPHKVNPIDFENAEGNLGIANSLLQHLAAKLPVSRMQRDLSDSTVQRNLGVAVGYAYLAYQSMLGGLERLDPNLDRIAADLEDRWELMAEPIQTVMRKHGVLDAYEQLKALTRGEKIDEAAIRAFVETLDISAEAKQSLLELTPSNYTGLAEELAKNLRP